LVHIRAKRPQDPAGVGILQGKATLDSHEANTHGKDLTGCQQRFSGHVQSFKDKRPGVPVIK
jgi:hypothetical protein